MAWALWLATPLAVILLAAAGAWLHGRPARPLRTRQSIAGHEAYLSALGANADRRAARGADPAESDS